MNRADRQAADGYALLTSPGPAAIACIRVWGPLTGEFVARHLRFTSDPGAHEKGQVRRAALVQADGETLDDILVSIHANSPHWDVRLHLHGNPALVRRCAALLEKCGLLPSAEPGKALWSVTNLLDAEAVEQLPRVRTRRGVEWLLSQPGRLRKAVAALRNAGFDADVRESCRAIAARRACLEWFTQPLQVALIGPPNAGKSTLANALADRQVSLVASQPGTTRDWVEVAGEMEGQPVTWFDTAGLCDSADPLERASLEHTRAVAEKADAVVVVLDASPNAAQVAGEFVACYGDLEPTAVALNKADQLTGPAEPGTDWPAAWAKCSVAVSARDGTGLDALQRRIVENLGRGEVPLDAPAAFTDRQERCLKAAAAAADSKIMQETLLRFLGGADTKVGGG